MEGYLPKDVITQAIEEMMQRGAITKKALQEARLTNKTFNDLMSKIQASRLSQRRFSKFIP